MNKGDSEYNKACALMTLKHQGLGRFVVHSSHNDDGTVSMWIDDPFHLSVRLPKLEWEDLEGLYHARRAQGSISQDLAATIYRFLVNNVTWGEVERMARLDEPEQ